MLSTRDVVVRPLRDDDVGAVCAFLNRLNIGPNHWGIPYEPDAFRESLAEYGIVEYLVATVRNEVVAVFHFSPTQQGMSSPEGIWAQLIVIDPQFRGTRVAEKLLRQAVQFLVNAGYNRVEATASAEGTSLRLQKRGGFRQVSDAPLGSPEETLHLVNYIPYLVRYVFRAFAAERDKLGLTPGIIPVMGGNPLNLAALPPVGKAELGSDRVAWHGGWGVPYSLNLPVGSGTLECLVDLDADAVTSVAGQDVSLACWPVGDRRTAAAGQATSVRVELTNNRITPMRVELTTTDSPRAVFDGVLEPGATWADEVGFTANRPGRAVFALDAAVSDVDGGSARRFSVATSVHVTGAPARRAAQAGPNRAEAELDGWLLTSRTLAVNVSATTGAMVVTHGPTGQPLLKEMWPDVGPPYPTTHHRPLGRAVNLVELGVRDGVPELVLEAAANAWVGRDPNQVRAFPSSRDLDGLVLRRGLRLVDSGLLEITTTVRRERGEPADPPAPHHLRIWPWALVPDPSIVVPLDAGLLVSPVMHMGFPFGLDNLEHLREIDLPAEPADVPAGWCAFEGGQWVAGLAWQDAHELRFGHRWMPSVLFAVPALALGDEVELPRYHLTGGRGDHRLVADAAFVADAAGAKAKTLPPRLATRLPLVLDVAPPIADPTGAARLRGALRVVAGRARPGRLRANGESVEDRTAPGEPLLVDLAVQAPARPGVHDVEVSWEEADGIVRWPVPVVVPAGGVDAVEVAEQEDGIVIDNGVLRLVVAPGEDGTVHGLAGGFARFHLLDPGREWAVHPPPIDVPWRFEGKPWAAPGDSRWRGVELVGTAGERWPGLSATVVLATCPGAPLLWALAAVTCSVDALPDVAAAFTVRIPRAPGSSVAVHRADGPIEIGTEEAFAESGTDAPRVAYGEALSVLQNGPDRVALVADGAAAWASRWRPGWQLTAHRPVAAGAGQQTRLDACIALGPARPEALRRLGGLASVVLGQPR